MKHIQPAKDDIWQRLDRYLRKIFPWAKLWEIYEALRTKKITIWGKKLPENTRLRTWDILDVDIEATILRSWQTTHITKMPTPHEALAPARIIYEDWDLLIYDKPSWLIVHSPDHKTDEVSLIEQIDAYLRTKWWQPEGTFSHPALAHRIDRDTSWIIVSCLNRVTYEKMADLFKTRKVHKTYHAIVSWIPHPPSGTIHAPLLRINTEKTDKAKVIVDPSGQTAETSYTVLKSGQDLSWSLVELHPKTGRTHQIRVHMAHIGHPLIGDKRYGGPSVTRFPELSSLHARRGHLLHASSIEFVLGLPRTYLSTHQLIEF